MPRKIDDEKLPEKLSIYTTSCQSSVQNRIWRQKLRTHNLTKKIKKFIAESLHRGITLEKIKKYINKYQCGNTGKNFVKVKL